MASEAVRDFILQYKAELEDLTSNVKVTINTLSQLADEWKREAAPSVAALLEKRLLNVRMFALLRVPGCVVLLLLLLIMIMTGVGAVNSVIPNTSYLRSTFWTPSPRMSGNHTYLSSHATCQR